MESWFLKRTYLKQTTDLQERKVKFGQKSEIGNNNTGNQP